MKNILLVDDDITVLRSLERLFKSVGYGVVSVSSGQMALECIEKIDFDVIVIDIRMPNLDGVETVKQIKAIRSKQAKPDTPVLFITGFSDAVAIDRAKSYGEVVLKPFDLEDLLSRIRQQCEKKNKE